VRFWAFLLLVAGCERLLGLDDIKPPDATVTPPWTTVSAGNAHSCGIRTDGSLWCWGDNFLGQLALGSELEIDQPRRVEGAKWSAVSAGSQHTCGLQVDGSLWCWGRSFEGEIGIGFIGNAVSEPTPAQVEGTWHSVTAGGQHTCGLRADSTLWCWGRNTDGQLGTGASTFLEQPSPVQVPQVATAWSQVAAGFSHTCAIDAVGSLFCWGTGNSGELGDGAQTGHTVPMPVNGDTWTKIATGFGFTCGITSGHLRCWGRSLGNTPQAILLSGVDTNGWIDVATGSDAPFDPITCALRDDGSQWCFGDNKRGVLGPLAAAAPPGAPVQAQAQTFTTIAVGGSHSCSVATDQTLWCIGGNGLGQLGDGYGSHRTPTQIPGTWTVPVTGYESTCALDDQGAAACAGGNRFGDLGDTTYVDRQTFAPVAGSASFTQLALGADTVLALTASGLMWSWGEGDVGTLGNGSLGNVSAPQMTNTAQTWIQLAATLHGCGIDATHNIFCWGNNDNGELGNGSTNIPAQPTPVMTSITTWNAVATGISHTCAIAAGGAYCWGRSDSGQLGSFNTTSMTYYSTPQTVAGSASFTAITCGNNLSCALDSDGHAWCWGDGTFGQLGVGGLGNLDLPQVIPGKVWRELSAGYSHTCGIQADGSLWCWGLNNSGQLGDGTLQSRDTPTPTGDPADKTWAHVSAGTSHTCATKADHSLWCWGGNANGQLGDGTAWRSQAFQVP
jgi:alpha-tubulin suppressor-like RCC1 family protein